ncbi:primase C-terminal domain-containing protein [Bacillus sp. UNCCL81]|uniref:primase C-terminal domain-containing protein n=1 Tax=Bacillus sp. UNCCL81 TaxID=1502755 RepID=UPI0003FEE98C|nr:primase C-terminal domain-containing protein [Bacillus sp. UNCCL81]SFD60256.1 Primase C terminal 1 (PriCT-1) [Bacillus sp. UNCCL81]
MFQVSNERKVVSVMDVIQFMTHDSLLAYKKKGSKFADKEVKLYETTINATYKGSVFLSSTKEDLSEGRGYVVTSYETLHEKVGHASHWTPNTFRGGTYYNFQKRIMKGHTRENLKQVNVMGFDMDVKDPDQIYRLYLACDELGLPRPNVLLETPRGFQFFFVLATPFYIHNQQNFKSLRVAERVFENIRSALLPYAKIDVNCTPFGFYRMPSTDNLLDFHDVPVDTNELLEWSKEHDKKAFHIVYQSETKTTSSMAEWYQVLIQAEKISPGHYAASRNNALFTLALENYAVGRSFEDTYDELDQFNSNLQAPLNKNEFERTVNSAYKGKYKGAKRSYVEGLLANWTDERATFQGRDGWYKFKKNRTDRKRSHYEEWEADITKYLLTHTSPENPYLEGSLKNLAETLNIPLSSFKEVLKRSSKLIKRTIGKGRNAVTILTSEMMLVRQIIHKRKTANKSIQMIFSEISNVINNKKLSLLSALDIVHERTNAPPNFQTINTG